MPGLQQDLFPDRGFIKDAECAVAFVFAGEVPTDRMAVGKDRVSQLGAAGPAADPVPQTGGGGDDAARGHDHAVGEVFEFRVKSRHGFQPSGMRAEPRIISGPSISTRRGSELGSSILPRRMSTVSATMRLADWRTVVRL